MLFQLASQKWLPPFSSFWSPAKEVIYDCMVPLDKLPQHWIYYYLVISHINLTDGREINYLLYLLHVSGIKVLSCHKVKREAHENWDQYLFPVANFAWWTLFSETISAG
jgi:hypothetical protein